jgi:hypothetical protein
MSKNYVSYVPMCFKKKLQINYVIFVTILYLISENHRQ